MVFEDWLRSSLPGLHRYATVLCGPDGAEEVVQEVAIRLHDQWEAIESLEQSDPYARKLITRQYLSGAIERPQRLDGELDGLTRQQRAALVLRYLEGLDDQEIAQVLETSAETVVDHISRAMVTLGIGLAADESAAPIEEAQRARTEDDLRVNLNALADRPLDSDALFESIVSQLKRPPKPTRRTGLILVLAICAIVAAVITPQFFGDGLVDADDARVPGNWNLVHRVQDPPNGWVTIVAFIEGESETSWLGPPGALAGSGPGCTVEVRAAGQSDPSLQGVGRVPVTIQGQPGFFSSENTADSGGVSWAYSADAWINVACKDRGLAVDKELSMQVAEKVAFKATESKLPFKLSTLPDAYGVERVAPQLLDGENAIFTGLLLASSSEEDQVTISDGSIDELSRGEGGPKPREWETETINGLPVKLSAESSEMVFDVGGKSINIRAWGYDTTEEGPPTWSPGRRELLIEIAKTVTLADDLGDQSTWFEVNATLPS